MGLRHREPMGASPPRIRRVLMERYDHDVDLRGGGGVEMASLHLERALDARGIAVEWYTDQELATGAAIEARLERGDVDAVVPLVESALFIRPSLFAPRWQHRVVRLWHDVTRIVPPWTALPRCPAHAGGADADGRCHAAAVAAGDRAANVFLSGGAWTRCFARRHYIPWAVDHLPPCDHRSRSGPVLLLAGKIPLDDLVGVTRACDAAGVPTRIIFSNWTQGGRRAKRHFAAEGPKPGREVIQYYDVSREHARVFGGISAALVLSRYHETFNFLAAEAVHFGLPVVALPQSGATLRFAAAVADLGQVADLIRTGRFRALEPRPRPAWGWHDVAAAYEGLLERMDDPAPSPRGPTEDLINGGLLCRS